VFTTGGILVIMKIVLTGRHLDLDENIRSYAEKKLRKAETYFDRIIEAHMTLSAEKHRRIAEVTLHAKKVRFHAQEETESIFASIDGVMEKIGTQIVKYKERLKNRKHIRGEELGLEEIPEGADEEDSEDIEESEDLSQSEIQQMVKKPVTKSITINIDVLEQTKNLQIARAKMANKPMTIDEAIIETDYVKGNFLMFTNSQTKKTNLVYKYENGNHLWIMPESE